ncbi:unnamed protein product [Sphagnum compactum]
MAKERCKRDKEEMGCQPPEGPVLCTNNCGFYGDATTMGMCSKCYKDSVLKQSKDSSTKIVVDKVEYLFTQGNCVMEEIDGAPMILPSKSSMEVLKSPIEQFDALGSSSGAAVATSAPGLVEHLMQQHNRCFSCNKRVGLTGFKCRCGNTFCSLHRYSDKHNCSFDYKTAGRDAISKANPVVKADKFDKI